MDSIKHTAILGAGVIGASWAALFLAAGKSVTVFDPAANAEEQVEAYVKEAWPVLIELGLATSDQPKPISFVNSASEAVAGADFVQESVPERLPIKHALYQEIEEVLSSATIVASSASGLTLTQMQDGWKNPSSFVLGHPFNPPHLIPLVEVMGNDRTNPQAIDQAEAFYQSVGKVTIRVNKEVPGHVANRLQAAVWREAIHLVKEGTASVGDVDKAIWAGPGLRWAAMGPTTLFHLGAGEGGLNEFCNRYTDSFNNWWKDLGTPHLDEETAKMLVRGIQDAIEGQTISSLSAQRDARILAIQKALRSAD